MSDMRHIDEMDENMNDLLLQKNFDELTNEEREKVLKYAANAEEYNMLRQTLLAITSSFVGEVEEDFSTAEVKNDLMSQFQKKYGTDNGRAKVIPMYRKPYFQLAVAASIALLVFVSFPLLNNNKDSNAELALNAKTAETMDVTSMDTTSLKESPAEEMALTGETSAAVVSDDEVDGLALEKVEEKPGMVLENKPEPNEPIVSSKDVMSATKPVNTITLDQNSSTREEEIALNDKANDEDGKRDALNKNLNNQNAKNKGKSDDEYISSDKKSARKETKEEAKKEDVARSSNSGEVDNLSQVMAGTVTSAPAKATINAPATTEAFIENNKTEMMNLLFTAF